MHNRDGDGEEQQELAANWLCAVVLDPMASPLELEGALKDAAQFNLQDVWALIEQFGVHTCATCAVRFTDRVRCSPCEVRYTARLWNALDTGTLPLDPGDEKFLADLKISLAP